MKVPTYLLVWLLAFGKVVTQWTVTAQPNESLTETHSSEGPIDTQVRLDNQDSSLSQTEQKLPEHTNRESGDDSSLEDISSNNPYDELFPDKPIQLLRPDPEHHRKLEVVNRNVKYLHRIDTAVAVVAVVGKFHSGKSFLLNQLMGKTSGFGVGPSVRPQTMGIWMWGKPKVINHSSGEPLSVIFLDTEGFAASNISESYDAKIFSVATLLSSYLIYNSVKIIDQGDIDYLELLARRTQLFALRSQVTKAHWFEEFNRDLLVFPPLVWVVQDFVQTTEDEDTPQEWLHRIMETSSRESGDYDINLLGIFDSVDCHTLFLPATKKYLLQDLSRATEEDLTPEYREERDSLIERIMSGLVPKEKNGRHITGPELATLLEVLVKAANEGSVAEIPGRWEVFIDQLKISSLEDCLTFYESDMALLSRQHGHDAINETALHEWHVSSMDKAKDLLSQLLFGLEDALEDALESLQRSMEEQFEKTKDINDKKIKLKCSEVQRKIEIESEGDLHDVVFPMRSTELQKVHKLVWEKAIEKYHSDVGHLSDNSAFGRQLEQLESGLTYIFNGVSLKNNEAFERLLEIAVEKAVKKFKESSKNTNRIPRTSNTLASVVEVAISEAKKVFAAEGESAREESLYRPYLGLLQSRLSEEAEVCSSENLQLIKAACQALAMEIISTFKQNTGPRKMLLPLNDTELNSRLKTEKEAAFKTYSQTQTAFDDTVAFSEIKSYLSNQLEEVCTQRRDENYKAYIKEVEVPLATARKLIQLSADKYDTEFSVKQYMIEVCMLNLDEGKAKLWQESLKRKIAEKFIQESAELQKTIKSKRGWWSSVKGFVQWIFWLFGG